MQMPSGGRNDVLAGLIFIGFGLAFGIAAARYPIGTALRMGPGYFPLLLAGALGLLGAAIVGKGLFASGEAEALAPVPWRAVVLISAALVFFGATVARLGLAPALFVAAFVSALSSRDNGLLAAALLAAGLTALCIVIFSYGLGVPVPVIGPWLRF
jgi:hypothetical protein